MTEIIGQYRPEFIVGVAQAAAALVLIGMGLARSNWPIVSLLLLDSLLNHFLVNSAAVNQPPFNLVIGATTWTLSLCAVLHVFRRGLSHFPAIAHFSRKAIIAAVLAGCAVSALTLESDISGRVHLSFHSAFLLVGERGVATALALSMLLAVAYLAWLPLPLPDNILRSAGILFLRFAVVSAVYLYWNRYADSNELQSINLVLAVSSVLQAVGWGILLRPAGEIAPKLAPAGPTDTSALLRQLEAINQSLARN